MDPVSGANEKRIIVVTPYGFISKGVYDGSHIYVTILHMYINADSNRR